MTHPTDHDFEQLSAYLDGELKPAEAAEIEARLQEDPQLQRTLAQLRWMSSSLRQLPALRAPRRYRLTHEMVGQRERTWRLPALRFATAALALALVAVIGLDFLQTTSAMKMAGAPQAMEAPVLAQDSAPADEITSEKSEQESQAFGAARPETTPLPPMAESQRAAGPTTEADAAAPPETPPLSLAVPESAETQPASEAASGAPPEGANAPGVAPTAQPGPPGGFNLLRLSELLLGAALVLVFAIQIRRRR